MASRSGRGIASAEAHKQWPRRVLFRAEPLVQDGPSRTWLSGDRPCCESVVEFPARCDRRRRRLGRRDSPESYSYSLPIAMINVADVANHVLQGNGNVSILFLLNDGDWRPRGQGLHVVGALIEHVDHVIAKGRGAAPLGTDQPSP